LAAKGIVSARTRDSPHDDTAGLEKGRMVQHEQTHFLDREAFAVGLGAAFDGSRGAYPARAKARPPQTKSRLREV